MPLVEYKSPASALLLADWLEKNGCIDADLIRKGKGQVLVRCPHHADNTPSLSVDTDTGLHQCFVCGNVQGNVYHYLSTLCSKNPRRPYLIKK